MALSHEAARRVYDRIGRVQDWQGFYERRAVERLLAHSALREARAVVEFGFGTGRLAAEMLSRHLPAGATYAGFDVSPTMLRLARRRLERWNERARLVLTHGAPLLPLPDRSADRLVSTYTLDLLDELDQAALIDEAARVLRADGRLCLASIAPGTGGMSTLVANGWAAVWRRVPELVGGCRPIRLTPLLDSRWALGYRATIRSWGTTSEVVVARCLA